MPLQGDSSKETRSSSLSQAAEIILNHLVIPTPSPSRAMSKPDAPKIPINTLRDFLQAMGVFKIAISVIIIAILIAGYYLVSGWSPEANSTAGHTRQFLIGVIPSVLPGLLVVIFAPLIFRKISEFQSHLDRELVAEVIEQRLLPILGESHKSVQLFESFARANWSKMIEDSKKIEIVVQYFDGWINNHSDDIRSFFAKGGEVTLVLPDPDLPGVVAQIHSRFPDKDKKTIARKIKDTSEKMKKLRADSGSGDAKLEVVFLDRMVWYCAIVFDDRILTLSPFEHARSVAVEAPVFYAMLGKHDKLKRWWSREIDHIKVSARGTEPPPSP